MKNQQVFIACLLVDFIFSRKGIGFLFKTLDFGAKAGGFNVLNIPDSLVKNSDQFWNQYNKPFLDKVIQRRDDIVLATKPTKKVLVNQKTGRLTGFGREFQYLQHRGYSYDSKINKMVKGN